MSRRFPATREDLPERIGSWRIRRYAELDSTSTTALELGAFGAPARTVVVADRQTGGRGRGRRHWFSRGADSLTFSVVLRPHASGQGARTGGLVAVAAGLCVARSVEALAGLEARVKWPNDVVVDGRKVAGMLVETSRPRAGRRTGLVMVVGVGVNLSTPLRAFPDELRHIATSITAAGGPRLGRAEFLGAFLRRFARMAGRLERGDAGGVIAAWRRASVLVGRRVSVRRGRRVIRGVAAGLDRAGALVVRTDDGAVHVETGTVSIGGWRSGGPLT
jgi:BirA family biotin operon repressor/biotin-[acetyl-CoA-carboxylase] ligase